MPKGRLLWRFRKKSEWYERKPETTIDETVVNPIIDNSYKNPPDKNGVCPDCGQRYGLLNYHQCKEANNGISVTRVK